MPILQPLQTPLWRRQGSGGRPRAPGSSPSAPRACTAASCSPCSCRGRARPPRCRGGGRWECRGWSAMLQAVSRRGSRLLPTTSRPSSSSSSPRSTSSSPPRLGSSGPAFSTPTPTCPPSSVRTRPKTSLRQTRARPSAGATCAPLPTGTTTSLRCFMTTRLRCFPWGACRAWSGRWRWCSRAGAASRGLPKRRSQTRCSSPSTSSSASSTCPSPRPRASSGFLLPPSRVRAAGWASGSGHSEP
mmetsp:Transcript_18104/g.41941  ORF Transcript_18104/g.41941 Transcript_18104/m.41941 type:complete len:244 (+) Transcript_18104:266-997(+)